jgi:hypothetical protein
MYYIELRTFQICCETQTLCKPVHRVR